MANVGTLCASPLHHPQSVGLLQLVRLERGRTVIPEIVLIARYAYHPIRSCLDSISARIWHLLLVSCSCDAWVSSSRRYLPCKSEPLHLDGGLLGCWAFISAFPYQKFAKLRLLLALFESWSAALINLPSSQVSIDCYSPSTSFTEALLSTQWDDKFSFRAYSNEPKPLETLISWSGSTPYDKLPWNNSRRDGRNSDRDLQLLLSAHRNLGRL